MLPPAKKINFAKKVFTKRQEVLQRGKKLCKREEVMQEARGFEERSEEFCDRKDKENKWFARK